jgi:2-dehydropantoate 2-reductase
VTLSDITRSKRIAILGSGANGASIGADLTRAGLDVTLIEQWPEHVEVMRQDGLRVVMPGETQTTQVRTMHLCEAATLRTKFDVVLLLVKAYDTRWASHLIEPYLAESGLLVGVQNGMTLDTITEVVGEHRTLGCVIEISSGMFEPGVVERHSPYDRSWFAVGSEFAATAGREYEVAELLELAGPTVVVDDIRATKWMKLVSNSTTLVSSAVLGLPLVEALELPGMRELMLRAGQEALNAGLAQGLAILPIFGLAPEDVREPDRVVEVLLDTLVAGFVLSNTTTTVLQDWGKGRRSEVEDVNGRVVAELAKVGGSAPTNAALVELAHRIERGELEPSPANAVLLADLAGTG